MWVFTIAIGQLRNEGTGTIYYEIYSGDAAHKNDYLACNLADKGPIPPGVYWIGEARDTPDHGPEFIPLIPVPGSVMFGRSSFGMHGDNINHPGEASHGCVIGPRNVRDLVSADQHGLFVVLSGRRETDRVQSVA